MAGNQNILAFAYYDTILQQIFIQDAEKSREAAQAYCEKEAERHNSQRELPRCAEITKSRHARRQVDKSCVCETKERSTFE